MKKFCLLFFTLALLVSCSNEDLEVSTNPENTNSTKSVTDKTFKTELIASNVLSYSYCLNLVCTDLEGNLYYIQGSDLMKYDLQSEQTSTITNVYDLLGLDHFGLCTDSELNIYITNGRFIYMIAQDGSKKDITSRFPGSDEYGRFTGLCANNAGMVYVTMDLTDLEGSSGVENNAIYRFSATSNVIEMVSGITYDQYDTKSSGLAKSAGVHIYGTEGFRKEKYVMIDTRNGDIQYKISRLPIQSLAADPTSTKVYILSGQDIYHMRPTVNSDILVGTIPSGLGEMSYYTPSHICTVPGASLFYALVGTNLYKLTLE